MNLIDLPIQIPEPTSLIGWLKRTLESTTPTDLRRSIPGSTSWIRLSIQIVTRKSRLKPVNLIDWRS